MELYKCPHCNEKKAYRSSTYPTDIVCWCNSERLNQVAILKDGYLISIPLIKEIKEFKYKLIKEKNDLIAISEKFKNPINSEQAGYFVNNYNMYLIHTKEIPEFIIFSNNKELLSPIENAIRGTDNQNPTKEDAKKILKLLIKNKILTTRSYKKYIDIFNS
jgi:hypothetical protein